MNSEDILIDFIRKSSARVAAVQSSFESQYQTARGLISRLLTDLGSRFSDKTADVSTGVVSDRLDAEAKLSSSVSAMRTAAKAAIDNLGTDLSIRLSSIFEGRTIDIPSNLSLAQVDKSGWENDEANELITTTVTGTFKRALITPFLDLKIVSPQIARERSRGFRDLDLDAGITYQFEIKLKEGIWQDYPDDFEMLVELETKFALYVYNAQGVFVKDSSGAEPMLWKITATRLGLPTNFAFHFFISLERLPYLIRMNSEVSGTPNAKFFFQVTELNIQKFLPRIF